MTPVVALADPDCAQQTIQYSFPDNKGTFRETPEGRMTQQEKQWYCDYDWTKERQALRREFLKPK